MLSLGSLVGFVTVLGIAARNGIMLVSHYRHLEDEEGEPFGLGLVLRGVGGAAGADPDDGAGDRPGPGAAGHRRQQAGPRDRVPDGRRDPRRAGHLDLLNLFLLPPLYATFGKSRRERRERALSEETAERVLEPAAG